MILSIEKITWVKSKIRGVREREKGGGGAKEGDYEIETRVSDCEKKVGKRKLMTNCKCSLAALTDRPIILLAHLEAMPG